MIWTTILWFLSDKPMKLGFLLIIQTIIYSLYINFKLMLPWISISLLMAFIGGILIIMIYLISLSKPMKTKMKVNNKFFFLMTIIIFMTIIYTNFKTQEFSSFSFQKNPMKEMNFISFMYSWSKMKMSIYMVMFLFISMLAILKVISNKSMNFIN
uniref:NADH dehydrogenase subunit 6 n=1 Tax=Rhipiphorothrips cruentatus TaxID=764491 RepID=A0A8A5L9K9_9NEOP|nr:NADH dehydrogenase subunit 6 [Rhipiphorothrips cruentatus]